MNLKTLIESPDYTLSKNNIKCYFDDSDAFPFGWLYYIFDIPLKKNYLIYVLDNNKIKKHYKILQFIASLFYFVVPPKGENIEQLIEIILRRYSNKNKNTLIFEDFEDFVRELFDNEDFLDLLRNGQINDWYDDFLNTNDPSSHPKQQINYRQLCFYNAGRIWLQKKVLAFWGTEKDVSKTEIDKIFNVYKVSNRKDYVIDTITTEEIKKGSFIYTKINPSYDDYTSQRKQRKKFTSFKKHKNNFNDLLGALHGVAGAQKNRFSSELDKTPVGSNRYGLFGMDAQLKSRLLNSESKFDKIVQKFLQEKLSF